MKKFYVTAKIPEYAALLINAKSLDIRLCQHEMPVWEKDGYTNYDVALSEKGWAHIVDDTLAKMPNLQSIFINGPYKSTIGLHQPCKLKELTYHNISRDPDDDWYPKFWQQEEKRTLTSLESLSVHEELHDFIAWVPPNTITKLKLTSSERCWAYGGVYPFEHLRELKCSYKHEYLPFSELYSLSVSFVLSSSTLTSLVLAGDRTRGWGWPDARWPAHIDLSRYHALKKLCLPAKPETMLLNENTSIKSNTIECIEFVITSVRPDSDIESDLRVFSHHSIDSKLLPAVKKYSFIVDHAFLAKLRDGDPHTADLDTFMSGFYQDDGRSSGTFMERYVHTMEAIEKFVPKGKADLLQWEVNEAKMELDVEDINMFRRQ